ncbi:MAG: phosphoribosylformylglycinamidine synthase [Clostridia bacterium]|nr:phosphoribosylformylglycinamidine synthase [Clostridia bacterium]
MIKRIYVEKREGFDVEARSILADIRQNLGMDFIDELRLFNRYDIADLDDETFEKAKHTVFSEPAADKVYDESLPADTGSFYFGMEYLAGQYDQRADSAMQCLRLINPKSNPLVKCAKIIAVYSKEENAIDETVLLRLKNYLINPVDSTEASFEKPESLEISAEVPKDVATLDGFVNMTPEQLENMRGSMGLAMSGEDIAFVQNYYAAQEKRNPTITEIRVIDTYWSDHCRHTTFNTKLTNVKFNDSDEYAKLVKAAFEEYLDMRKEVYAEREKDKDVSLMDMACIGAKYLKKKGVLTDLDESEEINACSIRTKAVVDGKEEDWIVMFKNETHNHPTEIEPFGGAATCLGGAIRDPLSGRSYVYQAMRVTGCADPGRPVDQTLEGKLPQMKITQGAAAGYSSYGNQIGLATGLVDEIYDEAYVAKRMEIGAVVGAAPAENIVRMRPKAGDIIVLLGGRTGRDGCGGATGSSKGHTKESILTCGAEVQKGNPPVERNLQRMFRRKEVAVLIKRCNDFGAGGVSVAIGELADSLEVNLDLVPKKYEGLDGTELAISESQERMAVVIAPEHEEEFMKYAKEENLEATTVAKATDTGRFVMTWRGKKVLDLSRDFLNTNGVTQQAQARVDGIFAKAGEKPFASKGKAHPKKTARDYLSSLQCCSRKGLIERFDSTIGAGTILMPLGGKYQLTPACGMAAKLPLRNGETDTATMMSWGFDPEISSEAPFLGAYYAVIDSVTKIAAMGGDFKKVHLTFQEYFEKLGDDPVKWGKPASALLGALKVQKELGIASIGGKDSMSGTFMDINVPPTLVSFAIAVCDANHVVSSEFKKAGSTLVYLPAPKSEDGTMKFEEYKANLARVAELAAADRILAANTVGVGGLFIAAYKMTVGNRIGAAFEPVSGECAYASDYGSMLLEIDASEDAAVLFTGTTGIVIGKTTDKQSIYMPFTSGEEGISIESEEAESLWKTPLERIFPTTADGETENATNVKEISYTNRSFVGPHIKTERPRVLIPVFPGTNCEVDSARAFEKAGAQAELHMICNQTEAQLTESISELEKKIRNSQIIMIPGGFSGGDEPDGSAKFITAVFRNPAVADAVSELMENRDGLMLGICNGFQALIKLGLVPFGKITEGTEQSPTLTFNRIGRHVSQLVRTRIASDKSPWLAGTNTGDIFTIPVSHGEGRFEAGAGVLEELVKNGQIATQYVDLSGRPSMQMPYNPNGSVLAVEGITSPDGRIFGKMGHSERIGKNLYRNVPGERDQKLFESGVNYFK